MPARLSVVGADAGRGSDVPAPGRIARVTKEADQLRQQADEHRWEAARLISEELADGTSQRELARQIGKSQAHVRDMARVWEIWGRSASRPPFNLAYNAPQVRGSRPQPLPGRKGREEA
jgi:hypothetical protein